MSSYFVSTPETVRVRCLEALSAIEKLRKERVRTVVESLCDSRNSEFFRMLMGKPKLNPDELLSDRDKLNKFRDFDILGMDEIGWAEMYGYQTENLCNQLLCACKDAKELHVSTRDWQSVSNWARNA